MNQMILSEILACPRCKKKLSLLEKELRCTNLSCNSSKSSFLLVNSKPVLVDYENSIIEFEHIKNTSASSVVKRNQNFFGLINIFKKVINGSNKVSKGNFKRLDELMQNFENPSILIIGGGTIGAGSESFFEKYRKNIVSFDVYNSPNVDFIADGHSIPLIDKSIDLVILQAVLEHVFGPVAVVNECLRVSKLGGYVYAETPFLQHVHEGAYDFTRFTVLGQRILFKNFDTVSMGYTSGVGQSLLWAIEYFISGLFRNRKAGKFAKVFFFWIRWLEYLIPYNWNSDGACGCYFLGQKLKHSTGKKISEYLVQYDGAQK